MTNIKLLKGSFVIAVVGNSQSEQFTVHHPIGVTQLDDSDWVITPTGDIAGLIARKDDPSQAKVNANVREAENSYLVERGFLTKEPTTKELYYKNGKKRSDVLTKSNAILKERVKTWKAEKKAFNDLKKSDKSLGGFETPQPTLKSVMDTEEYTLEMELRKQLNTEEGVKYVKGRKAQTYETKGGRYKNVAQKAINAGQKYETSEMIDMFVHYVGVRAKTLIAKPRRSSVLEKPGTDAENASVSE